MTDPIAKPPAPTDAPPGKPPAKPPRGWRHDSLFKRIFKNVGLLIAGEGAGAVIGLVALSLQTRGLGVVSFGLLVLVQSYVGFVAGLVKFQVWQAVVKYGAEALASDDKPRLFRIVLFCSLMDLGTALTAGTIAALAAWPIGSLFGWSPEIRWLAVFYSLAAVATVSATPVGILRLFDRFDLLAAVGPITPALRLGLTVAVFFYDRDNIWLYAGAWLISSLFDRLVLMTLGWRELARRGLLAHRKWRLRGLTEGNKGIWSFVWANNIYVSLNMLTKQADTMVVGALAGPAAAGLYKIAKQFGALLGFLGKFVVTALFPELASMWVEKNYRHFRRTLLRVGATAAAAGLLVLAICAAIGQPLLHLTVGPEFLGAYSIMLILVAARVVGLASLVFNPALVAMGRAVKNLKLTIVVTAISLPALLALTWAWGPHGAAGARMVTEGITLAIVGWAALRLLGRKIADQKCAAAGVAESTAAVIATKDGLLDAETDSIADRDR